MNAVIQAHDAMSRLVVLMGARTGTLDQIGGAKKVLRNQKNFGVT